MNKHAQELGRLSAKARKGITNYSALGRRTWKGVSKEERKRRMAKVRAGRKKLST